MSLFEYFIDVNDVSFLRSYQVKCHREVLFIFRTNITNTTRSGKPSDFDKIELLRLRTSFAQILLIDS